jgi:anti-sigma regulatory factor (Ser/Thr protein kinase)
MRSRRDAVAPMVERIIEIVKRAGLSQERRDNLAVALAEALSNAAVHGHRGRPHALVLIAVTTRPDGCAVVDVTDSGPGFDVASVVDPTDPHRLLMPGGRGVFLMRRLVDRLEYNPNGNHVRLVMEGK